jgi:hypothetical protein
MNIPDKAKLFSEVRRALKPGGRFGVYDIMRVADAELPYPVPWSAVPETSFVERPETYRELLTAAGFKIEKERNQRDFVLLAREMREQTDKHGAPPLSLHVIMGPATPQRLGNVMGALNGELIAPIEMITMADRKSIGLKRIRWRDRLAAPWSRAIPLRETRRTAGACILRASCPRSAQCDLELPGRVRRRRVPNIEPPNRRKNERSFLEIDRYAPRADVPCAVAGRSCARGALRRKPTL